MVVFSSLLGIYQLVGQVNDKIKCEIFGLNNYYFQKAC